MKCRSRLRWATATIRRHRRGRLVAGRDSRRHRRADGVPARIQHGAHDHRHALARRGERGGSVARVSVLHPDRGHRGRRPLFLAAVVAAGAASARRRLVQPSDRQAVRRRAARRRRRDSPGRSRREVSGEALAGRRCSRAGGDPHGPHRAAQAAHAGAVDRTSLAPPCRADRAGAMRLHRSRHESGDGHDLRRDARRFAKGDRGRVFVLPGDSDALRGRHVSPGEGRVEPVAFGRHAHGRWFRRFVRRRLGRHRRLHALRPDAGNVSLCGLSRAIGLDRAWMVAAGGDRRALHVGRGWMARAPLRVAPKRPCCPAAEATRFPFRSRQKRPGYPASRSATRLPSAPRSFAKARSSICRTRSLLKPRSRPSCSSVFASPPRASPK